MNTLGPLFAVFVSVDLHLAALFLLVNTTFSFFLTALAFRGRPLVDRWLIFLGLALVFNTLGLLGCHVFARTPVHDFDAFLVP